MTEYVRSNKDQLYSILVWVNETGLTILDFQPASTDIILVLTRKCKQHKELFLEPQWPHLDDLTNGFHIISAFVVPAKDGLKFRMTGSDKMMLVRKVDYNDLIRSSWTH